MSGKTRHLQPFTADMTTLNKMSQKQRVTSTKETVYGWYPPQWNVYSKPNYKQLSPYDKECLYKHWYNSCLGQKEATAPTPPGMGCPPHSHPRRQDSAPAARRSSPFRSATRAQSATSGLSLKRQLLKQEEDRKKLEQELRLDTTTPQSTKTTCELIRQSWTFNKPKEYQLLPAQRPGRIPKPDFSNFAIKYSTLESFVGVTPCENEQGQVSSRPRSAASPARPKVISRRSVRSATVRRPQFSSVPKVEKIRDELRRDTVAPPSPAPSVSPSPSIDNGLCQTKATNRSSVSSRAKSAPPTAHSLVFRPQSPTPNRPTSPTRTETASPLKIDLSDANAYAQEEGAQIEEKPDVELTYAELVDKYGWKAQMKGDPLKLKKNIIRERLAITVQCSVPEPIKDPPKVHRQVWDTYFLNTQPRRPRNFTIAPDWVSEVLHAKRIELQDREGLNYRYKDFAFAY